MRAAAARHPIGDSAPHAQPSAVRAGAARHPIFCMYEFPSAERAAGEGTARSQPAPAPGAERAQRARERPLQDLTVHWQRLNSVPRGAHGRLARAAEEFARAAMTAQDTGFRRHALQSLVRELDRQHAALVMRLSRERRDNTRDCPHTTQLRNWVVHVKRRVSAVMKRARAPLEVVRLVGDYRAIHSSTLSQFVAVAEEEVKEMHAPPGADHAQDTDSDDVADDLLGLRQFAHVPCDDLLGLRQFAYVPGARRAGQSSAGARAGRCGREDLAAASAAGAEASLLVRGLEGLCSPGFRGQPAGGRAPHGES